MTKKHQKYIKIKVRVDHWSTVAVPVTDEVYHAMRLLRNPDGTKVGVADPNGDMWNPNLEDHRREWANTWVPDVFNAYEFHPDKASLVVLDMTEEHNLAHWVSMDYMIERIANEGFTEDLYLTDAERDIVRQTQQTEKLTLGDVRSFAASEVPYQTMLPCVAKLAKKGRSMLPDNPDEAIEVALRLLELATRNNKLADEEAIRADKRFKSLATFMQEAAPTLYEEWDLKDTLKNG